MASDPQRKTLARDLLAAFVCGAMVATTAALCCAAVPLYSVLDSWRGGGLAGAAAAPSPRLRPPRLAAVRFDHALAAGLRAAPRRAIQAAAYRAAGPRCFLAVPRPAAVALTGKSRAMMPAAGAAVALCVDGERAAADGAPAITLFYAVQDLRPRPAPLSGRI